MRLSAEAIELLGRDEVPFLGAAGAYRVLLVEFPHDTLPAGSLRVVEHLIARKIRPLIAHPERNKAVMRNPELIRPFVDAGCWLQLTAASLTGGFGRSARQAARYLLGEELAWVVATDAHNLPHRPPLLAEARAALVPMVGERMAHRMVDERPGRIFAGEGGA